MHVSQFQVDILLSAWIDMRSKITEHLFTSGFEKVGRRDVWPGQFSANVFFKDILVHDVQILLPTRSYTLVAVAYDTHKGY